MRRSGNGEPREFDRWAVRILGAIFGGLLGGGLIFWLVARC